MTAQQIFEFAMDLVQKRQKNGVIDANKTASYKVLSPGILTLWQAEISKSGDLYKTLAISNKPVNNMLGVNCGFDYLEFQGTDITKEGNGQAKAYHFEVDGPGTVYIEDYTGTWNVLATITVPDTVTSYTAYKGVVTPTTGSTKSRIRFSGTYRYLITNYALFSIPLSPTRIPDYKPWVKVELPSDFKCIDQVVTEYFNEQYSKDNDYKIENRKDFYYNYYFEGQIRIIYKPIPVQITTLTQTLEVDEITSMSGAYFLAAHLMLVEDPDSASFFEQKYEEHKIDSNVKEPMPPQKIIDVYSIGG
jgi:hypothetical protein